MAKILTTAIVADIRNKLNGSVFSKNRYGSYVRTKVTPVNPQSTAQQNVRNRLATNSQAWRGLTEGQRQSWISGAANFPTTDIFGNAKILSGNALYVGMNNNLNLVGEGAIADAPSPIAIPAVSDLVLTAAAGAGTLSLAYGSGPIPADFVLVIESTPMIAPGISFVKNRFRVLSTLPAASATPANIAADFVAANGNLVAGQKVFIRVKLVSTTTGQAGIPIQTMAIIAA